MFFYPLYVFFKILSFPFDAGAGSFSDLFSLFLNFKFIPSTRSGRAGPLLSGQQKVGKDRRKGVSPPCESPDQSGVLDAPLWKPPSPRWRGRPGRTPRRLRGWSFGAVGEGRERVRARHGRRTSTASVLGAAPPCPLRSPLGNVCRSCAPAHGTAFETAFAATPSQI